MKKLGLLFGLFGLLISSCAKEDLVDTSANGIEDVNALSDFEARIGSGVSVMFFHASWCSVCAEQRPAVEAASESDENAGVFFGEVEFEDNDNINQTYNVIGFPTLIIFKDGVEIKRFTGKGHSQATIQAEIDALL